MSVPACCPEDVFPRLRWGRRHGALASHTDVCEKVEVTCVEKGHAVVCVTVFSNLIPHRDSQRNVREDADVWRAERRCHGHGVSDLCAERRCHGHGVSLLFVVATGTKSAMVKLAVKIDESASNVVGVDVSPRPADCGLPVDGMALVEFVVAGRSHSCRFLQGRHGSASHPL